MTMFYRIASAYGDSVKALERRNRLLVNAI